MAEYIRVVAEFDEVGEILPLAIRLEGRTFRVDRVDDVRQASSLKAGGQGIRYTCQVHGVALYLYRDDTHWFMERIL